MNNDLESRAERREQDVLWAAEDRDRRIEERREDREEERKDDRGKMVRHVVGITIVTVFIAGLFFIPRKAADWSNCNDVCELNGDEPYWKVSHGCYCKGDGDLYNPRDER